MSLRGLCVLCALIASRVGAQPDDALPLTLREAVERALAHNAELAVRAAEVAAAEARARAAGRPPPISLSLSPASIIEQLEIAVSHVLGISKQRKWASRAARHELAATLAGNEEFRLELVAAVKSAYWRLRIAQERLAVAQKMARIAEETRRSADRLLEEGLGRRIDLERAQSELDRALVGQRQAQAEIRQAQTDLALLINVPPETRIVAVDSLPSGAPPLPPGPKLQRLALERRPAMRRMAALAAAASAGVRVVGAERNPSIEFSAEREEEINFGRALIELPLIDLGTIKYGKRAARAEAQASSAEAEVVRLQVKDEVQSAADAVVATAEVVQRLRDELIPRQTDIVNRLQRGFEQRAIGYLDLIEAQATLQELRAQWLEAESERLDALVRLERAVGVPLEEIRDASDDS